MPFLQAKAELFVSATSVIQEGAPSRETVYDSGQIIDHDYLGGVVLLLSMSRPEARQFELG
jgi:hypothetical protein